MNPLCLYRFIYLGKNRGVTLRVHPLKTLFFSGLISFSTASKVNAGILNVSKQSNRVNVKYNKLSKFTE